jgi:hypothetical protein
MLNYLSTGTTLPLPITFRQGLRRKRSLCIFEKACLLIRYLARDVLLLRSLTTAGLWLPSHFIAMGK